MTSRGLILAYINREIWTLKYLLWELNMFQQLCTLKQKYFLCQREMSHFSGELFLIARSRGKLLLFHTGMALQEA